MAPQPWIVDNEPSRRFPLYTRGNVGEVFPDPVTPLSWTLLGVPGAEAGFRDALVRFGAFDHDQFDPEAIELLGVFGGYAYLNLSLLRVFGVRTPGVTPELMDLAIVGGEATIPPYEARPTDASAVHTRRVEETINAVLATSRLPELAADRADVEAVQRTRPDLDSLTDTELVAHVRAVFAGRFRRLFARLVYVSYAATVPMGMLAFLAEGLGEPSLAVRLLSGVGDVESAEPSLALWELSRLATATPAVAGAIDESTDGLMERLVARSVSHPEVERFLAAFHRFTAEHGARGPNEWEMRSPTWETHPDLALIALDVMRRAPPDASPRHRQRATAAGRAQLLADLSAKLPADVASLLMDAARAAAVFQGGRERAKTTIVKLVHEGRLAFLELGRRMVRAGHFERPENFAMITDAELDEFVAAPASFADAVREREFRYQELAAAVPPLLVDGKVPAVSSWPRRASLVPVPAPPGSVLRGVSGAAGRATGRARVVSDPFSAQALEPGDVLVAPLTDPSWTPLFVTAGAVVVEIGAQISHAVIVSRELGIPCVVSVPDATRTIPDGAVVTVDGAAGTVTLA